MSIGACFYFMKALANVKMKQQDTRSFYGLSWTEITDGKTVPYGEHAK